MKWIKYPHKKPLRHGWYDTKRTVLDAHCFDVTVPNSDKTLWWNGENFSNGVGEITAVESDDILLWTPVEKSHQQDDPYITIEYVSRQVVYNPIYGDDRVCECGDTYDRHFDSYEDNAAVGCKYCECFNFKEDKK